MVVCILSLLSFFIFNGELSAESFSFQGKTSIENPLKLRDPFSPPLSLLAKKKKEIQAGVLRDGVYTNIPDLTDVELSDIQVVGVVIGKKRSARVKVKGKDVIIPLKEGMKIGKAKSEVKAILPAGIMVAEEIKNIYGQKEYLETIIPISK